MKAPTIKQELIDQYVIVDYIYLREEQMTDTPESNGRTPPSSDFNCNVNYCTMYI